MRYLIIGASAAAVSAVSTLRDFDTESEIVVVSKDEQVHSRCMLHKVIGGERSAESINFAGKDFFEKNNVVWEKGRSVTAVDPVSKTVTLDGGSKLSFDKLLIATGSVSSIPPVKNLSSCKEVCCLHDLEDAVEIKEITDGRAKKIVVIGAGLVGMDAVSALLHKDLEINVVEMADRILPIQLDNHAASVYQKKFEENSVNFYLSRKLTNVHVDQSQHIQSVELDEGTIIPCDLIIVTSGVRPNISFLENSGIATDKGIVVDEYMHTSQKDIFAAGDVTGVYGMWEAAVKQAKTAALNMLKDGQSKHVESYNMKNTMNFFDLPTLSIGYVVSPDDSYDTIIRRRGEIYQKLIVRDGIVTGAIFMRDISNKGHWQNIIKSNLCLSNINKPLLDVSYADFFETSAKDGQYSYV